MLDVRSGPTTYALLSRGGLVGIGNRLNLPGTVS
jgi:hypothetical protein